MWICSDVECHRSDEPVYHSFQASASINAHEEVEMLDNVCCTNCSYEADWCDDCLDHEYCEAHGGGNLGSGEPIPTPFTQINWVKEPSTIKL